MTRTITLFTPGIKMRFCWSELKWTSSWKHIQPDFNIQ